MFKLLESNSHMHSISNVVYIFLQPTNNIATHFNYKYYSNQKYTTKVIYKYEQIFLFIQVAKINSTNLTIPNNNNNNNKYCLRLDRSQKNISKIFKSNSTQHFFFIFSYFYNQMQWPWNKKENYLLRSFYCKIFQMFTSICFFFCNWISISKYLFFSAKPTIFT